MTRELTYTIISNKENDNSEIHTCLEAPHAPITKLTITGLTTLCSNRLFEILLQGFIHKLEFNEFITTDDRTLERFEDRCINR